MLRTRAFRWEDLWTPRAIAMVWAPIIVISILHYSTDAAHHWHHDIFRRLYYIPIILAAFTLGVRGALAASVAASLIYAPHAFMHFMHQDPGKTAEKALEVLLYNVIALVAGFLADREFAERKRQEATAAALAESIEDKKEMEKLLIRAGRLQAMGELTAGLAHEIRNPLASIQGAAETLIDEIPPDSPNQKMADILMRELKRLGNILDRFLSFAKPEEFDLREVSLGEVVGEVAELMGSQAAKDGIEIIWEPLGKPVLVLGEREKITQVLMNLVLNAIQAMPKGGRVDLACHIRHRRRRRFGAVAVTDDGPGVPEEMTERIFNPFFTTKEGGVGLGLAVAARIVDQHQGFIEMNNAPGRGARFEAFFPMDDSLPDA